MSTVAIVPAVNWDGRAMAVRLAAITGEEFAGFYDRRMAELTAELNQVIGAGYDGNGTTPEIGSGGESLGAAGHLPSSEP